MDEYELSLPKPVDAEAAPLGNVKANYNGKESDELMTMINTKPAVMHQDGTRKGIQSEAVEKGRDRGKAKSPQKLTADGDFESSGQDNEISDLTASKKIGTYGRLKSDITKCLDKLKGAAPCKQYLLPKANRKPSCEREETKSSRAVKQNEHVTLKIMEHDGDVQGDNLYDLYEEVSTKEEKVVANKSANNQTGWGIETILRLLRRSADRLRSDRSISRRFLSWRASASAKTPRNKNSTSKKGENDKRRHKNACALGLCREGPQQREDRTKVSAHNGMKCESEWNADAEYEYDEMVEYKQQLTREYFSGTNPNTNFDLYDDIPINDDFRSMGPAVHKPNPKLGDNKQNFVESGLKGMKNSKPLNAENECRKQSIRALDDGAPDGDNRGDIYMNSELLKRLPDKVGSDSPPPIPPKMSQITQTHENGKNSKKALATGICNEQHSGIIGTFKERQLSLTRIVLPTKKNNVWRKEVTRMLGLFPMKPRREKKPVYSKEVEELQTNKEPREERLANGKVDPDIPDEEDEYEEYCYAIELAHQPEIRQRAQHDKLCSREHPSVGGSKKLEINSDMLSTVENYVNEDYYEDPETSASQIFLRQERPMNGRKGVHELQTKDEKMPQTPGTKRYEEVQKLSDRRLPAPPIPVSEPTVAIKQKAPMLKDSQVIRTNQSYSQIKQQRKEKVPEGPPRGNTSVSRTESLKKQSPKGETTNSNESAKENLLMLPSKVEANQDTSPDELKSTSQPKTIPEIPPRPHYIPKFILLKLANPTKVNMVQERQLTPEATEQRTNQEREPMDRERVKWGSTAKTNLLQ
ncbi:hypothetical protein TcWFU_010440 [Taenia crassiceps]|uniref:Uncharacterized protein n=1 Tax=Taenia crassiceps TaxID=6207 RepID=A0ABR4QTP1_9CEST